jgi:hypothetical protein
MGKHFNAELYRQFDRTMDKGLDEAMGDDEPPLTEFERAAEWDDERWTLLDDVNATFDQVFKVMR